MIFIIFFFTHLACVVAGLLIGRRNPKIATTAQDLADAAKKAAGQ